MPENTRLRLTSLEVENILRIKAVSMKFVDDCVIIEGWNEHGKSSVLKALEIVLAGMSVTPAEPIHEDEKKGKIVATFGDFVVTKLFKRGGKPTLKITSGKRKFSSPQGLLETFLNFVALRPLQFLEYDAAKQLSVLSDLMGLDTAALDREEKGTYDDRRDANREVKRLEAAYESLPSHPRAPKEEVKVAELMAELEKIQYHNKDGDELRRKHDLHEREGKKRAEQIEELERQLANAKAYLGSHSEERDLFAADLEAFFPEDDAPLRDQIAEADNLNSLVRANAAKEEARKEYEAAQENAEELDTLLESIKEHKAEELQKAAERLPVPELTLTEEGIRYKGKPLAQAGASAELRIAVAVAMALNEDNRVKLLLIDNAEKLDPPNTKLVVEMAAEKGFQVLFARVGAGKDSTVLIEDGTIKEE